MNNFYELMKMSHKDAEEFVGHKLLFPGRDTENLVISLDEWFTNQFSTKYSILRVFSISYTPYRANELKTELVVFVPGIDDFNFRATFKPTQEIHLSSLTEMMEEWVKRYSYRNINCHALEDYCRYLGVEDIDWN